MWFSTYVYLLSQLSGGGKYKDDGTVSALELRLVGCMDDGACGLVTACIKSSCPNVSGPWYVADMDSAEDWAQPSMYMLCSPAASVMEPHLLALDCAVPSLSTTLVLLMNTLDLQIYHIFRTHAECHAVQGVVSPVS